MKAHGTPKNISLAHMFPITQLTECENPGHVKKSSGKNTILPALLPSSWRDLSTACSDATLPGDAARGSGSAGFAVCSGSAGFTGCSGSAGFTGCSGSAGFFGSTDFAVLSGCPGTALFSGIPFGCSGSLSAFTWSCFPGLCVSLSSSSSSSSSLLWSDVESESVPSSQASSSSGRVSSKAKGMISNVDTDDVAHSRHQSFDLCIKFFNWPLDPNIYANRKISQSLRPFFMRRCRTFSFTLSTSSSKKSVGFAGVSVSASGFQFQTFNEKPQNQGLTWSNSFHYQMGSSCHGLQHRIQNQAELLESFHLKLQHPQAHTHTRAHTHTGKKTCLYNICLYMACSSCLLTTNIETGRWRSSLEKHLFILHKWVTRAHTPKIPLNYQTRKPTTTISSPIKVCNLGAVDTSLRLTFILQNPQSLRRARAASGTSTPPTSTPLLFFSSSATSSSFKASIMGTVLSGLEAILESKAPSNPLLLTQVDMSWLAGLGESRPPPERNLSRTASQASHSVATSSMLV